MWGEQLDGQGVTIVFTVGAPVYTRSEGKALVTVCGPGDAERMLRGDHLPDVIASRCWRQRICPHAGFRSHAGSMHFPALFRA